MIPLLITIKCSFLPRITTMIDGVAIVLRTIKELGGNATMQYLQGQFPGRVMSKRGTWSWPTLPPD